MATAGARLALPARCAAARAQCLARRSRAAQPAALACDSGRDRTRSVHVPSHPAWRSSRRGSTASLAFRRGVAASAAAENDLYEAIVVVAGGMTDDGGLPPWVVSRLDHAAAEYARHASASAPAYVLLSGSATPHKPPPLAKGGFLLHESTAMAEYLIDRGVPPEKILKDTASMDTIGNAYFSLVQHAVPRGWTKVVVVTSAFHMGRTRAAFEWVWNLWRPAGVPVIAMDFAVAPDDGLSPDVVAARAEREAKSEAALRANAERVTDLPAFAEWLYTTHLCYAVTRQHEIGEFAEMKSDPALKSY